MNDYPMKSERRIDPYQSRANLNPPNDGKNDYSILYLDYWDPKEMYRNKIIMEIKLF